METFEGKGANFAYLLLFQRPREVIGCMGHWLVRRSKRVQVEREEGERRGDNLVPRAFSKRGAGGGEERVGG